MYSLKMGYLIKMYLYIQKKTYICMYDQVFTILWKVSHQKL